MINLIKIKCPFCGEKSELFLSINPSIIILNCPECWAPLMYNNDGVRILSEQELRKIPVSKKQKEIKNIFDKVSTTDLNPELKEVAQENTAFPKNKQVLKNNYQNSSFTPVTKTCSRRRISKDDIIDLRIALAQCNDIKQLLEKI